MGKNSAGPLEMARNENQKQPRIFFSQFQKCVAKQSLLSLKCASTEQDRSIVGYAQGPQNRPEIAG